MRSIWATINKRDSLSILLSLASTAIVTVVLLAIRDQMETATVVLLYLLPVGASAAIGGLGPGIIAAVVAFFSLNYFFLPPYGTLIVHQSQDIVVLVIFLVLAVSISQLVGRMTNSLTIARARENETTRLYELSQSLSRLQDETDILRRLTQHTLETFQAERVDVFLEGGIQPVLIRMPDGAAQPSEISGKPDAVATLEVSQQRKGEIRLWRSNRSFRQAEERLLYTFAHQAVLAMERASLTEQARQAELLKATEKLQSSLLNSISHDLRTPLVSITGALSSLREKSLSLNRKARDSLLKTAYEEAERLNRLVGNLLNMTRLEAGVIHIHKELCDIQDVIGAALEQLGERAAERQIIINLPEEMSLVSLDTALFEQALVNLLENAAKYSPPKKPIGINVSQEPDSVRIEISDRGLGIPPGELEHVFDKFYRVQRPESVSGTGLGLAICKGIVEAHGGTVEAENRTGGGTIMIITLPKEAAL